MLIKTESRHQTSKKSRPRKRNLWFERIMALLSLVNLGLVMFDLSYIPLRDFWLQGRIQLLQLNVGPFSFAGIPIQVPLPAITKYYDWVKGIEPYRDTEQYLQRLDQLQMKLASSSLGSPQVSILLEDLRDRSQEMINDNPFQIANKTGNLEKIKNRMRVQLFANEEASAQDAFREFWSQDYLKTNTEEKLNFFGQEIKPLLKTNYFRPIDETGQLIDNFGLLDFPFAVIFACEFLGRTWYISSRHTGVSWLDAMLWRWYDLFLFIPVWRWLRLITVTIRLHQSQLINLSVVQKQISQGFVAGIAEDMTEVVVVRVIDQMQASIRRGDMLNILAKSSIKPYIDLNDVNETAELAKLVSRLTVYQVMPEIRPDIEALLQHNLEKTLQQFPPYQGLQFLPGMEQLQANLAQQVAQEFYRVLSDSLRSTLAEDPVNEKLLEQLITNLTRALSAQMQTTETTTRVQYLLEALLEEIKINYIEQLSQEDVEEILEKTRAIRAQANQT